MKLQLIKLPATLFGLSIYLTSLGQTFTEKLILTDTTTDSLYLKSENFAFDINGNYCFEIKENDQDFFVTKDKKIGGFKFIGSSYGSDGDISYSDRTLGSKDIPWYYRNANGSKVYGPVIGKLESQKTDDTKENIAITTTYKDSAFYYINGKCVSALSSKEAGDYLNKIDWCAFSENGNILYYTKKGKSYYLYKNDELIDSSTFRYDQLAINDRGEYIYAEGHGPDKNIYGYDYLYYIHSADTTLGYVRTVWDFELKNNGAYYYSADDNGPDYIAVNNKLYKDIDPVANITLVSKDVFLYSFGEKGQNKINVSGKIYPYDFEEIFYPTVDKKNNFAFYGLKEYYLYKFVNGVMDPVPISRYNTRGNPLYISPKGESIHYFKTDDSIYVYRNDQLLFKPVQKNFNIRILSYKEFLPHRYTKDKSKNGNSLFYLQYDSTGYWVYNGVFSKPMIPAIENSYRREKDIGEIVDGKFDDDGFFIIQKTGENKFIININNTFYKEIEGMDEILKGNCYLSGKELTFFGIKGLSFYQYTLNLP